VLSACKNRFTSGYLTQQLLAGSGIRTQPVGTIYTTINNSTTVIVKSMISGLQLSNNQGINNYVKVDTSYDVSSNLI